MHHAEISYMYKLFWLPRTSLVLQCYHVRFWQWAQSVFSIGMEKLQAYWHTVLDCLHIFHYFSTRNISHTTKLPHHHARLPCTLYKPVVWGQSHGSRASSPVPSVHSTGTLLKTTMLCPPLDSDHQRRRFLSCALPILLLLNAVATCHMLPCIELTRSVDPALPSQCAQIQVPFVCNPFCLCVCWLLKHHATQVFVQTIYRMMARLTCLPKGNCLVENWYDFHEEAVNKRWWITVTLRSAASISGILTQQCRQTQTSWCLAASPSIFISTSCQQCRDALSKSCKNRFGQELLVLQKCV